MRTGSDRIPPILFPICLFQEARKAQLENHEPEEEEEEEMEAEEKEAGGSGKGLATSWEPWERGQWDSPAIALSQMRSARRAAAVRRKAARMSAPAVRVTGRRATGMRQVTRVAVVRMRAARMKLVLPGTKRRFSVAMLTQKMMLTLMRRTEGRPTGAVTMTRTVAVMVVASGAVARAGAAVGVPAPSQVAVSTRLRRMAARLQLLIPVRRTVTVTEPADTVFGQGSTFLVVCFASPLFIPTFSLLLLIIKLT